MKLVVFLFVVVVLSAVAFYGYSAYHRNQLPTSIGVNSNQSNHIANEESEVPKSGDLCGDTGGIGQIVKIGENTITLKRKDGKDLITHLTSKTTIKISTGSISMSGLKIGDRVTLVGGPNPDNSFTAEAIFVCMR